MGFQAWNHVHISSELCSILLNIFFLMFGHIFCNIYSLIFSLLQPAEGVIEPILGDLLEVNAADSRICTIWEQCLVIRPFDTPSDGALGQFIVVWVQAVLITYYIWNRLWVRGSISRERKLSRKASSFPEVRKVLIFDREAVLLGHLQLVFKVHGLLLRDTFVQIQGTETARSIHSIHWLFFRENSARLGHFLFQGFADPFEHIVTVYGGLLLQLPHTFLDKAAITQDLAALGPRL